MLAAAVVFAGDSVTIEFWSLNKGIAGMKGEPVNHDRIFAIAGCGIGGYGGSAGQHRVFPQPRKADRQTRSGWPPEQKLVEENGIDSSLQ